MSLTLRPARSADGAALLALLEKSPAKGQIRIVYTRRPDAYESFQREAPDAHVFVWEADGRVVGVVARLCRTYYVDGVPKRGDYICGLKKDPTVTERLDFAEAFASVTDPTADFTFCSVLSDNSGLVTSVRKARRVPAELRPLGDLTTFLVKTGGRGRAAPDRQFRACQPADESALAAFYADLSPRHGLFPVGTPWRQVGGPTLSDFGVVTSASGEITAAGALWDQTDYRQYVVVGYSPLLTAARLLNPFFWLAGYPRLMKPNTVVPLPMASFLLAKPGDENALVCGLLRQARRRGYAQLVAGPAKTSPFHEQFQSRRHVSFDSTIYQVLPPDAAPTVPDISGIQCAQL